MSKGSYFRPRGYNPRYSKFQTALYVSRKARMGRGLLLTPGKTEPSGPNEKNYYFSSSRGPALSGGFWKVNAVRADSGGGTGGGGGGGESVSDAPSGLFCPTSGTTLWYKLAMHRVIITTNPYHYENYPGLLLDKTVWSDVVDDVYSDSWTEGGWGVSYETGADTDTGDWAWYWEEWIISKYHTISESEIAPDPTVGTSWDDPDEWPYAVIEVWNQGRTELLASEPAGFVAPWCSYTAATPPPSGGGMPAGYVRGSDAGQWAYACDCPDYAANEKPYNIPLAPSHNLSRSWIRPRPEFPCKHIVAAALANADMSAVMGWTSDSMADLPARELWAQAADNWANWERTTPTRWEVEEAYRRGQRSIHAAERRERQLEAETRTDWQTRKDLGDIWDMNDSGDYRGRFGQSRSGMTLEEFHRARQKALQPEMAARVEQVTGSYGLGKGGYDPFRESDTHAGTARWEAIARAEANAISSVKRSIGNAINGIKGIKPPQPPSMSAPRPRPPAPRPGPAPLPGEEGWTQEMEY